MTDKQFDDAFTAAGGWFILTQNETIAGWTGSQKELVDYIFSLGFAMMNFFIFLPPSEMRNERPIS